MASGFFIRRFFVNFYSFSLSLKKELVILQGNVLYCDMRLRRYGSPCGGEPDTEGVLV